MAVHKDNVVHIRISINFFVVTSEYWERGMEWLGCGLD